MIRRALAALLAVAALSSCSGSLEEALERADAPKPTVEVQGTVQTPATSEARVEATATTIENSTTIAATLPGEGAELATEPVSLDGWTYFPARVWVAVEPRDDLTQQWSSEAAAVTLRSVEVPAEVITERVSQLNDASLAEFGELQIYGGDYYYHSEGFETIWSRFDSIADDNWMAVQRYWIMDGDSTLELTLTGTDAASFDDEVFLVQGVINQITRG